MAHSARARTSFLGQRSLKSWSFLAMMKALKPRKMPDKRPIMPGVVDLHPDRRDEAHEQAIKPLKKRRFLTMTPCSRARKCPMFKVQHHFEVIGPRPHPTSAASAGYTFVVKSRMDMKRSRVCVVDAGPFRKKPLRLNGALSGRWTG